jgi:outer membrane protein
MKTPHLLAASAALILAAQTTSAYAAAARPAAAAAAPAPAAAPPPAAGAQLTPPTAAPIPGVCVFSVEEAIGISTVGKAFQARMQQLQAQVEAELTPEKNTLQSDANALQSQQASLAADVFQQRAQAMNQRIQQFQAKADLRQQEMQATQQKNLGRIAQELQPLLVSVYNNKKCAVVFNADGVISSNPGMDISGDVATALNGRMTTISFDREHLDQGQAGAAPAAAAPARR